MTTATDTTEGMQRPAGYILPGQEIVQLFQVDQPFLATITIILATYCRTSPCRLDVSLHLMVPPSIELPARTETACWKHVLQLQVDGRTLRDNERIHIFLPEGDYPQDSIFKLCLASDDARAGEAPTVWLHTGNQRIPGHIRCQYGREDCGAFGVMAELSYAPPYAKTSVPPSLLLSPITQCNLNCIHCISRVTRGSLNKLDPGIRHAIRTWCREGKVSAVATDYSGDLLWADRHFGHELDFFLDLNVPFHIDTNGSCLTGAVIPRLLASRLTSINVSLDAAKPETYRRVRRGAPPLDTVLANIREFSKALVDSGRQNEIRLSLSFTLMTGNLDELLEFIPLAAALNVRVIFCRHLEAYTPDMESESLIFCPDRFNTVRSRALALAQHLGVLLGIPEELGDTEEIAGHLPCPEPWRSAVVLGNGDVAACCIPGTVMGNLKSNTMEEIWQGPAYQRLRRTVNSSAPPLPCSICPAYRKATNRHSYLPFLGASC